MPLFNLCWVLVLLASSACPLMEEAKRLCKLPDGRDYWWEKLGLALVGRALLSSVQLSSVAQSCPALCNPLDCSTPGSLVHRQLLELTQTHVHQVGDGIQPSYPLLIPSPPTKKLYPKGDLSRQLLPVLPIPVVSPCQPMPPQETL